MKAGDRFAPEGQPQPFADAPATSGSTENHLPSADANAEFATVWPRHFDLCSVKAALGNDADQILCDVLAACVNGPIWSLVDRGGGRWRPTICRLAFLASGGVPPAPAPICQVPELLHTGSLIVDDIQDGAAERRGGAAVHRLYGIPTALNAANTAYFRALEALRCNLPDELRLRALDMLAEELFAAHLGQALDLTLGARLREGGLEVTSYFVLARAKTGALVRIAARLGAIAAAAGAAQESALGEWASELGVAYQIRNDVENLNAGLEDVAAARPTYPLLLLLQQGGAAARTLRSHLGRPLTSTRDTAALRQLFARERTAEVAGAAAHCAMGRALEALRFLPAGEARAALERITHELAQG